MEKNKYDYKVLKTSLIVLSVLVVMFTMSGNMITTVEAGASPITSFESFYVYITAIAVSVYMVIKDKKANISIVVAVFTYPWTYFLGRQVIDLIKLKYPMITISFDPFFYIYLASSIPLIISLFINDKKTNVNKSVNFQNIDVENITKRLDADNFLFASSILGTKDMPYGTEVLLVNNVLENRLDLIYVMESGSQTIKIPIESVRNITFKNSVSMQNISKKFESNETKSMLFSAFMFGGNPMLQLAGNSACNTLFDEISGNYDKVNFKSYYELSIEVLLNNQEMKFILSTDVIPNKFVSHILSQISK